MYVSFRPWLCREHVVADRVHQVRLAQAHAAVENSGLYERDGASATARHAACANWFDDADDERVEGVARAQADAVVAEIRVVGIGVVGSSAASDGSGGGGPLRAPSGTNSSSDAGAAHFGERFVE